MLKFRKRAIQVKAIQWTGDNTVEVMDWLTAGNQMDWLAVGNQSARWHDIGSDASLAEAIAIDTLEGIMGAKVGDWIIRSVKGEHYPCDPEIFAATYEAVPA